MKSNEKDRSKKSDSLPSTRDEKSEEYLYQSAGIQERKGYIPAWLILVAVGLTLWGGYYLVQYWSPVN